MRQTLISTVLLASGVGVCSPPSQLEVTAVRFWTLSEVTRIAVETNGEFHFRSDRLYNPERLFFDLVGARPRMGAKGMLVTPVNDKLLKRIRVAETQPGMTRVVLDLESPVEFKAEQLSNPDRLMIELRLAGAQPVATPRLTTQEPKAVDPQQVVEEKLVSQTPPPPE